MCAALPTRTRLHLASSLRVPGRATALFAADLGALALPRGADDRAAVCQVIADGLDRSTLAQLVGVRLRDLVPALEGYDGAFDGTCPARLRALFKRQGAATWRALGDLTLGGIGSWPGVGPSTAAAIVGEALRVAVDDLVGEPAIRPMAGPGPAAERLLSGPLVGPPHLRLATLDRLLERAGDARDRGVFEYRVLQLEDRTTLADLASALDISQERVRQLRARAEDRVRSAFAAGSPPASKLGQTVRAVADRLGVAAPVAAVDAFLTSSDLAPPPDSRSLLLVWLAGPYLPVGERPGWLATDPAALVAETNRLLHEDGGVREPELVAKELEAFGVAPEHVQAWLTVQPARVLDGLLVATSGAPLDVAERALSAAGHAMTVEELSAWARVPVGQGAGELWTLLRRDRRFVRVGPDAFELAEWGGDAYEAGPGGERFLLQVEVDAAVLSGSAAPVPLSLVQGLGLRKGARRTFATRYGPVALSHDCPPTHGSLRPVVLAAGATIGDSVLLAFHPDDDGAMVEIASSSAVGGSTA